MEKGQGGRICCDTALNGKATSCDSVLGKAKLLERCTGSDLDLCSYDIDTSDLLGDCVLDLAIFRQYCAVMCLP